VEHTYIDRRRIFEDGADMIGGRVAIRLTRLRHQVANVNFESGCCLNRLANACDQQVRNDARVKTPRSKDNGVGLPDRFDYAWSGGWRWRVQPHASNSAAWLWNVRFSACDTAVIVESAQRNGIFR